MSVYKDFIKANVKKPEDEDILMHYGVLGMKWGVRKESYYEPIGPISNKYYKLAKKGLFKSGVLSSKISSRKNQSAKVSGSQFVPDFGGKAYNIVKSSKKSTGSKAKGTSTKAKAEAALKEKAASAGKKGGSGGKGKSGSSGKEKSKAEKKVKDKKVKIEKNAKSNLPRQEEYVSVDPDFNEKYFTADAKLGNTNFYAFKRDDGRWVISDKNKKWVLPEGIEIDKADFAKKFEEFDKQLKDIIANSDYKYTEEDLDMWYTEAINKIISELKTPQESAYEQIANVINGILGEESSEDSIDYENEEKKTKIDENVGKTVEELEKKKKR